MTVRECLQEFLTHVASLEEEDPDGNGEDGFTVQFQALKDKSIKYKNEKTFTTVEGEKDINRRKNRYKDILPFDYTRVVLKKLPTDPGSDYINANFIKGAGGRDSYIAAQGPLPATVNDFWRMIWEYQVQVVVMVCSEMEDGKSKCQRYWPPLKQSETFGSINVYMEDEVDSQQEFGFRVLRISQEDETRTVRQFHFKAWPDHGVSSVKPILDMIGLVRESQPQETPPIVVHCSAGCGRTGTICAIDYAWSILKLGKLTPNFRMFDVITSMRTQRPSIVQARDQYILVNQAVEELFKRHREVIDQNDYENVDMLSSSPKAPDYQNMNFNAEDDYVCVDFDSRDTSLPPVVPKRPTQSVDAKVNQANVKKKAPDPQKNSDSSPTDSKAPTSPGNKPSLSPKPSGNSGGTLDKPKPPNRPDNPPSVQERLKAFQGKLKPEEDEECKETPLYAEVDKKNKAHTIPATCQNEKTSPTVLKQGAPPKAATLPPGGNQHVTQIRLSPENAASHAKVGYPNDDDDHSVFEDNTLYSLSGPQTNDYTLEKVVSNPKDTSLYSKEQPIHGGVTTKPASPVHLRYEKKHAVKPLLESQYSNPFELPERSSSEYAEPYDSKDMCSTADAGNLDRNSPQQAGKMPIVAPAAPPRTKKKKVPTATLR